MPGIETSIFSSLWTTLTILSFLMILTSVSSPTSSMLLSPKVSWIASFPWAPVMLVSSQTSLTENAFSPMPWTLVEAKVTVTPPGGLSW